MRPWKAKAMVPLLALPLAAGSVTALLTDASAARAATSCGQFSYTNPYLGYPALVPQATLSEGSTGPCVTILQQDLNFTIHSGLAVNGDFGPDTLTAVQTFQRAHLSCTGGVDGIADHDTMSCLAVMSG